MGTVKLMLGIFVIVVVVYLGVELIPPYFANYQFQDAIESEARLATYSTKTEDTIRDEVFKKASELEIPLAKDQIKVARTGPQNAGSLLIETHYTVHVDLPGYPLDITFDPSTKNKSPF